MFIIYLDFKLNNPNLQEQRHDKPRRHSSFHRARPADLGQHLSGYHRIPAAEPPVHRRAYPRVAGRVVAAGVDAQATATRRMGHCRPARFFKHRLFPGHVVCGSVPPAGRTGGGIEFDADADGAGVHLVNRQNHAAESGLGLGGGGRGGDCALGFVAAGAL